MFFFFEHPEDVRVPESVFDSVRVFFCIDVSVVQPVVVAPLERAAFSRHGCEPEDDAFDEFVKLV